MADDDVSEVTYWEYDDDDSDVVDYSEDSDDESDDPEFLGPTPFPLPVRVRAWFRKSSYKGGHRW